MDKKKLLPLVLVCILVLQVFAVSAPLTVSAAGKNGLQVVGGKTYYFAKGKKVTDKWVRVGGGSVKKFVSLVKNGSFLVRIKI